MDHSSVRESCLSILPTLFVELSHFGKRHTKTTMCTQVFLHKNHERKTLMTPFFNFYFLAYFFTLQYTLHIVTVRIYWQQYSIQLNMDYTLHISAKFPVNLEAAKGAWVWCTCLREELLLPMAKHFSLRLTVWSHLNFRERLRFMKLRKAWENSKISKQIQEPSVFVIFGVLTQLLIAAA